MAKSSLPDSALPPIVSAKDWNAAFEAMLIKEKELTRARDALAAQRRRMPMTPVETDYRFLGPDGEVGLLDLFAGRRQLVVYRFFYQPDVDGWPDKGCGGCSFLADHIPHLAHVNYRDTTFAMVSPADQDKIIALKQRMGWDMPWYTLLGDAFSNDFGVAEMFGLNVFLHDDNNRVFRTYFVNGRGVEAITPTWSILDITPLGRQEDWEDTPDGRPQTPPYWFGRHDEYP
ncbi:DUF899 domain-containing protein [Pseudonocardia sp. DSM 110487]|uniref:DUF899 domain-containing protein n=1 Tax=Pseudonocardia sp. DSM 110487 TaxID=2865833 RepID=UPI001C697286|nr:DUF899 domain-containing protein [Pseudonocardia sp. DSM 110487]QYN39227.1 DUF899 domain-containing protein [Pseudonocardia sp. DSM 110487]